MAQAPGEVDQKEPQEGEGEGEVAVNNAPDRRREFEIVGRGDW